MWARAVAFCLASGPALADVAFRPVSIAPHVYDGGWEHYVGGGLAVFDCDNDGWLDLAAAGGTNPVTLYRNGGEHDIRFEAESMDIRGVTGLYPIRIDPDSHADLVVLRVGPDMILRGQGDCRFTPTEIGFDFEDRWSTAFSATWEADADRPTLAFGHYVDRKDPDGPFEACDTNLLLRPKADGYVAQTLSPGFCALSLLFTDWARKGQADLRVSNDRHYYVRDGYEQLWRMEERPREWTADEGWVPHQLWGMGIATRDLDRDGRDEVYLSSMGDQRLQQQIGPGPTYKDVPFARGTAAHRPYVGDDGRPSTGWHIAFGDIQNDGRDDVFIAKGNVQQMPSNAMEDPNNLLVQQVDGTFVEAGDHAGVASLHRGRGAALADLNNDGLLDLAVVNRRAPLEVWQNASTSVGHWLAVTLQQSGPNPDAVGAWIEVDDGQQIQSREITVGGGHAGGMLGPQHFGLGEADHVQLRIRWPGTDWTAWMRLESNDAHTCLLTQSAKVAGKKSGDVQCTLSESPKNKGR